MDISIKNITGTTEQDIKNLNDNFKYIAMKLFEDAKTTTITNTETIIKEVQNNPLSNEIELPDGNITIYATCKVKNTDGTYTTKKSFYTLKPDGLYNYAGTLILPISGSNELVNVYAKFY